MTQIPEDIMDAAEAIHINYVMPDPSEVRLAIAEAILAERNRVLSTLPIAVEGKVKALEWRLNEEGWQIADTFFGGYRIERNPHDHWCWGVYFHGEKGVGLNPEDNFEAAKAAAQADFNERISSALAVQPDHDFRDLIIIGDTAYRVHSDVCRAFNDLVAASLTSSPGKDGGQEVEAVACERCQGNGEIVTDWERYKHPHEGDAGDEAVTECPDCNGEGRIDAQPDSTALVERLNLYEEILRVVCHHLELPQSESGPADDLTLYDRALEAADEYTKKADADLAVNRDKRFAAEALAMRLANSLAAFTKHHEKWMDRWDDDAQSSTFSRHTFGELRKARKLIEEADAALSSREGER